MAKESKDLQGGLLKKEESVATESGGGADNVPADAAIGFLTAITKHRRFVARFVIGATVAATVVTLLLPKWYKATATVLPAPQSNLLLGLQGVSSLFQSLSPGRALSSLTGPTEEERFAAILRSETALMDMINKFNLTEIYEIKRYPREKTMKELLDNLDIEFGDGGELEISTFDKDPIRAMMMANYFVEILNRLNADISAENATAMRAFIEERYEKNLEDLKVAEENLKTFQKKYGVSSLPVPELGVEYLRLFREVDIQSKILEYVLPIYEQAKVDEKRQTPSVVVLSYATMPERKAKPKVSLYALVSLVASTLISLVVVYVRESAERMRTLYPDRYNWIWKTMKSDWLGLRFGKNSR